MPVQHGSVLDREIDRLVEVATRRFIRGRFRDLRELHDVAALLLGVPHEGFFLNVQREPFPLLFTAADSSEGNELFHGSFLRQQVKKVNRAQDDFQRQFRRQGFIVLGLEDVDREFDQVGRDPFGSAGRHTPIRNGGGGLIL